MLWALICHLKESKVCCDCVAVLSTLRFHFLIVYFIFLVFQSTGKNESVFNAKLSMSSNNDSEEDEGSWDSDSNKSETSDKNNDIDTNSDSSDGDDNDDASDTAKSTHQMDPTANPLTRRIHFPPLLKRAHSLLMARMKKPCIFWERGSKT